MSAIRYAAFVVMVFAALALGWTARSMFEPAECVTPEAAAPSPVSGPGAQIDLADRCVDANLCRVRCWDGAMSVVVHKDKESPYIQCGNPHGEWTVP